MKKKLILLVILGTISLLAGEMSPNKLVATEYALTQTNYSYRIISLDTSVNQISPYEQSSTPLSLTATGDAGLDNVSLYYRWSTDNSTWQGPITDETNNSVDNNTPNVDSSADVGTETNFANAQDTTPDSDYMNIEEANTGETSIDDWYYVDAIDDGVESTWSTTGVNPYIDADDANEIYTGGNGDVSDWYTFTNISGTGSGYTVNLSCLSWNDGDGYPEYELDWTNDGTADASGSFSHYGSYTWETTATISGLDNATEINDCRVRFTNNKGGGGPDTTHIDASRLGIYKAGVANYTLDFEYNWSTAEFDKQNEELCIYVGAHTGTENLNVSYWTGSSWTSLGTISQTGWTNFTATGLTSSEYTIRLNGTNETSDTSQDNWDIDVIMLHTWNTTWILWNDPSNPDLISPWSWNFDFPDGTAYYEFYSIGKFDGQIETAPASADAICYYNP